MLQWQRNSACLAEVHTPAKPACGRHAVVQWCDKHVLNCPSPCAADITPVHQNAESDGGRSCIIIIIIIIIIKLTPSQRAQARRSDCRSENHRQCSMSPLVKTAARTSRRPSRGNCGVCSSRSSCGGCIPRRTSSCCPPVESRTPSRRSPPSPRRRERRRGKAPWKTDVSRRETRTRDRIAVEKTVLKKILLCEHKRR